MGYITAPSLDLLKEQGVVVPPTEDELPYSDGMPMESDRHILQMNLLLETLRMHWKDRDKGFAGGNMFVYFNLDQLKSVDFRGPDFFAVVQAPKRERKSWVCWQEGMGPDVVIELLSNSTLHVDKIEKKRIYEEQLRVPEYFWFHPFSGELAGFELNKGKYQPLKPDKQGRLYSKKLGLWLVKKLAIFQDVEAEWLRWSLEDGSFLLTGREQAEEAEFRASHEKAEREAAEQAMLKEKAEREAAEQAMLKEKAEREAAEQAMLKEKAEREAAEQAMLKEKAEREAAELLLRQAKQQAQAAEQKALALEVRLKALEEELHRRKE